MSNVWKVVGSTDLTFESARQLFMAEVMVRAAHANLEVNAHKFEDQDYVDMVLDRLQDALNLLEARGDEARVVMGRASEESA